VQGSPDWERLALVVIAMLLVQLGIGWTNDYVDREADALNQPWKPAASGLVDARLLSWAAGAATLGALLLALPLGLAAWLLLAGCVLAGLAYNLGLKQTAFSGVPLLVALALLPPYVWAGIDEFRARLLLLYAVALPLPLACHLANTLPDIDIDRISGRGGLAVALGRGTTIASIAASLLAPPLLIVLTLPWLPYEPALLAGTLAAFGLLAGAALRRYATAVRRDDDVAGFRLVAAASVLLACGWLAALK
jgi:4-hydroxybenzoate polyprenyltransferase